MNNTERNCDTCNDSYYMTEKNPSGGKKLVQLQVSAADVYGMAAAKRLGIEQENFYQCQNCNARVGCHKGTTRPLGNLANEALRMKRKETHQIFDSFWRERGMTRTQGYHWMAKKLRLSEQLAHIGGFEMDRCQRLIDLCEKERNKEAA